MRNQLEKCFQDTLYQMERNPDLKEATVQMAENTEVYEEGFNPTYLPIGNPAKIFVEENTTFAAALKHRIYYGADGEKIIGRTAVLNFANPHYPGGNVVNGAMAQEECLCRSSNLYASLTTQEAKEKFYDYHRARLEYNFSDRVIYSPDVTIFKTDEIVPQMLPRELWYQVDVITCAAPCVNRQKYINKENLFQLLKSRIINIFNVARWNQVDILILGAFGCGAFGNPPELVAKAFHSAYATYKDFFVKIVFAIKCSSELQRANLIAFQNEFFKEMYTPMYKSMAKNKKEGQDAEQVENPNEEREGLYLFLLYTRYGIEEQEAGKVSMRILHNGLVEESEIKPQNSNIKIQICCQTPEYVGCHIDVFPTVHPAYMIRREPVKYKTIFLYQPMLDAYDDGLMHRMENYLIFFSTKPINLKRFIGNYRRINKEEYEIEEENFKDWRYDQSIKERYKVGMDAFLVENNVFAEDKWKNEIVDGRYQLLWLLDSNYMGSIYYAKEIITGFGFKIKVIDYAGIRGESIKRGLRTGNKLLAELKNPAVKEVINLCGKSEVTFIVYENIGGNTLEAILKSKGSFEQGEVADYAIQTAHILQELHGLNPPVIHRDINPKNLVLDTRGKIYLVNFDIAMRYDSGKDDDTVLGTKGYAPPEQYAGHTDPRSDLYALGMTMYYLVTGLNPIHSSWEYKPIRKINQNLSRRLEKIIDKCVHKELDKRYQNADELLKALRKI